MVTATVDRAGVPPEISALWQDGLVTRIELQPPGHDDNRLMAHVEELSAVRRIISTSNPGARSRTLRGTFFCHDT